MLEAADRLAVEDLRQPRAQLFPGGDPSRRVDLQGPELGDGVARVRFDEAGVSDAIQTSSQTIEVMVADLPGVCLRREKAARAGVLAQTLRERLEVALDQQQLGVGGVQLAVHQPALQRLGRGCDRRLLGQVGEILGR